MWVYAIQENKLMENRPVRAYPGGIAVLLIKNQGAISVLGSHCPHMGCSLGGAIVEGDILQCPCHDWKFDMSTGRFVDAPEIGLDSYQCKIENGDVFINLERKTP